MVYSKQGALFRQGAATRILTRTLIIGLSLSVLSCAPASEKQTGSEPAKTEDKAVASPADSQSASARSGRVSYLSGDARLIEATGRKALKMGDLVSPGQGLQTGSATRLELSFSDGSRLRVGPAAEVRFAYQANADHALFEIDKGEVWGNIRPGKRKLVFQGKHSAAAVLGTVYNIKVSSENTCTRVMQGKVGVHLPFALAGKEAEVIDQAPARLTETGGASGLQPAKDGDIVVPASQWLQLSTNQCIIVRENGKAHVMTFNLDELAKQEEWLKWNRERDAGLPPH